MKIEDIIRTVAAYLKLRVDIEKGLVYDNGDRVIVSPPERQAEFSRLVMAANLAYRETVTDYLQLLTTEDVTLKKTLGNGGTLKVYYNTLARKLLAVESVKLVGIEPRWGLYGDDVGRTRYVRCKCYPEFVDVYLSETERAYMSAYRGYRLAIEYAYLPDYVAPGTGNEFPDRDLLTPELVAFGASAEYALFTGRLGAAAAFDERFKRSLARLVGGHISSRRLPAHPGL